MRIVSEPEVGRRVEQDCVGQETDNQGLVDIQDKQDKQKHNGVLQGEFLAQAKNSHDDVTFELEFKTRNSSLGLNAYTTAAVRYIEGMWGLDDFWSTPTFQFARLMKAYPAFTKLSAEQALQEIDWSLTPWQDDDDVRLGFLLQWTKVRFIPGWSPLEWALEMTDEIRLIPPRCENGAFEKYSRFVSMAGWLQVLRQKKPIFLPVVEISEIFDCRPNTVSDWRQLAVRDGYIKMVRKHNVKAKKATHFRFEMSKFPALEEWLGNQQNPGG